MRILILAAGLLMAFAGPALAQTNFDATGQFTLSFKFSQPGEQQEKSKPTLGFRFGASNVPQVRIEEEDPNRRGLNLEFDRTDSSVRSFAGVAVQFGEADKDRIRLLDDPFSAEALGLTEDAPTYGNGRIADYLRLGRSDGGWALGGQQSSGFGWSAAPPTD